MKPLLVAGILLFSFSPFLHSGDIDCSSLCYDIRDGKNVLEKLKQNKSTLKKECTGKKSLLFCRPNLETVEALINIGFDPNEKAKKVDNITPLFVADNYGVASTLIKHGARVNETDDNGRTPLFYTNYPDVFDLLLKKGAKINIVDKEGNTPLIYHLQEYGYFSKELPNATEKYISAGVNINKENNYGETALYWAVVNGLTEDAELLLKKGIATNTKNKAEGLTPLHIAVLSGNKQMVSLLLKYKANKEINDLYKRRPVDYSPNNEIVTLLGKDDYITVAEDLFSKREAINSSFDYSKLLSEDTIALFVGETHSPNSYELHYYKFENQVRTLIKELKNKAGLTDYATEFMDYEEQSKINLYQQTRLPREKFDSQLCRRYFEAETDKTCKDNKVEIHGLDIAKYITFKYGTSSEGYAERNNLWLKILTKEILEKKTGAKVLVYCGMYHSNYNSIEKPVSTLLKQHLKKNNLPGKVKVLELTSKETAFKDANGTTADRMGITNQKFIVTVPEDKVDLIGADFIINIPDEIPSSAMPYEVMKPTPLPAVKDNNNQ